MYRKETGGEGIGRSFGPGTVKVRCNYILVEGEKVRGGGKEGGGAIPKVIITSQIRPATPYPGLMRVSRKGGTQKESG